MKLFADPMWDCYFQPQGSGLYSPSRQMYSPGGPADQPVPSSATVGAQSWPEVNGEVRGYALEFMIQLLGKLGITPQTSPDVFGLLPKSEEKMLAEGPIQAPINSQNAFYYVSLAARAASVRGGYFDEQKKRLDDIFMYLIRAEGSYISSIAWGRAPIDAAQFNGAVAEVLLKLPLLVDDALEAARGMGYAQGALDGYAAGVKSVWAWVSGGASGLERIFEAWGRAQAAPVETAVELLEKLGKKAKEVLDGAGAGVGIGAAIGVALLIALFAFTRR